MRLDNYLYEQGYTTSRNKAKELILNKQVLCDSIMITKASFNIGDLIEPEITILQEYTYVGRAAYKLKNFLLQHPIEIKDKHCLDIGSSTGGFVQIVLEYGATDVCAVDVGTDQLHQTLRGDSRIKSFEQTDIRDFKPEHKFDIVTCDVSFVGIAHILDDIDRLASKEIIILLKPQFEVGRDVRRTRKGVVKNQKDIDLVCERFESAAFGLGWEFIIKKESEIKGKEGNVEIFYHFRQR